MEDNISEEDDRYESVIVTYGFVCKRCGCLVVTKDVHNLWHTNYAAVANDAAWGAMMGRPIA